jgi:hypothetical protein
MIGEQGERLPGEVLAPRRPLDERAPGQRRLLEGRGEKGLDLLPAVRRHGRGFYLQSPIISKAAQWKG